MQTFDSFQQLEKYLYGEKAKMYPETKCTNCSETSKNQPVGNGCHTCLNGIMQIKEKK